MSAEFRQRRPSEYLRILRRRKWLLILPMIAVTTAVIYVVYRLPDVYESTTLIVVKSSNLPNSVVPTVTEDSITRQLASISQVVTSRSQLEPLVKKYELYRVERTRNEAMESVIDKMRKDIRVEINTSRNDITNGFIIAYRYRDPKLAQAITSELASLYTNVQTDELVSSNTAAKAFIDSQVNQAKEALDAVDRGDQYDAAFLLEPTPVPEILAVAADGDVMPQKSTYFYPKALTGLVINPHEW